jgi:hypothetical protein
VLPAPHPGLVVSYSYLWHSQHHAGEDQGRKNRPCAIVLAETTEDGTSTVIVAPITHSKPQDPHAVEIPATVRRHLGMDEARSWVVTNDLNEFQWPYDLQPVSRYEPDRFHYGYLPIGLFKRVVAGVKAHYGARTTKLVKRR